LAAPTPRWFSIPAGRPFLRDLARGVWRAESVLGQEALAEAVILVPTRRSARELAEALLATAPARAALLPTIRALGDLDEGEPPFEAGDLALDLPPAIDPMRRRFELAGLAVRHSRLLERRVDAGGALELADALADFLDSQQIEERDAAGQIADLVEGDLARHWRQSAEFLDIALTAWPRRLAELGCMDVAARRVALLRRLTRRWTTAPPSEMLIAAGSTGSAPAVADLLVAVGAAPRGCVVLPGLDTALAEAAWTEVDEQHPQGNMRRLLRRAGLDRGEVAAWAMDGESAQAGRWRRRLINEALRPAEATADWLAQIEDLRREGAAAGVDPIAEGLKGLTVISAADEEACAGAAALLLREALETPGRTAALVTPDAALARRVGARLSRWDVAVDSSAGRLLAATPPARLLSRLARLMADPADPVALLAALKSPLTRLGRPPEALGEAVAFLEAQALRGVRPRSVIEVEARLRAPRPNRGEDAPGTAGPWLEPALALAREVAAVIARAVEGFSEGTAGVDHLARALATAAEALARDSQGGLGDLWRGPGGEETAMLISNLIDFGAALPPVTAAGFAELLDRLLASAVLAPGGAGHPRVRILGVLEARLISADLLVLAGLEEGVWPRAAPLDPFLSRPMRERLGLPPPERRVGLTAHDFAQAACAPEVVLIHGERRAGAPATPSRWLWRLSAVIRGAGLELPRRPELLAWARDLDAPLPDPPPSLRTAVRPCPRPPVPARPRRLPVTAVERWIKDPYGLYAQRILGLWPLERPDAPLGAMGRGTAIHAAVERFALAYPAELPAEAEEAFAALFNEALRSAGTPESEMAREQVLARRLGQWLADFERRRRPGARLFVERRGELTFEAPAGRFTLTARADRIEARGDCADIIDFKSGVPPSKAHVKTHFSPQLTLTAAILEAGGFAGLPALPPRQLLYVRLAGGRIPGTEEDRGGEEAQALAAEALEGLKARVAAFDRREQGYLSWEAPEFIRARSDYNHLARLWEWHVVGETGGDTVGEGEGP
jgi:ATP-dependent helicase/nuclease subunit B